MEDNRIFKIRRLGISDTDLENPDDSNLRLHDVATWEFKELKEKKVH